MYKLNHTKVEQMAKSLTKAAVDAIIKDLKVGAQEMEADGFPMDDSIAFELAGNVIDDTPGLKDYITGKVGASDYVGWLANQF